MAIPFHPPVKRSVEIAGHKTSISLEPVFWDMLRARAGAEGVPVNALVARIDAERLEAETPPGLAGAIRVWLVSVEAEVSAVHHGTRRAEGSGHARQGG
ncbi:ribbon-helix-helix domain-containing protein [Novosphingobium sp. M1R2S20]|uniref:Ribbon-helix-helix domain-containing protein n=1 Tax=Novosphingobium rhizovicinum TaxID=3228928 RepID=A0ABV3R963_9SPHN